MRSNDRSSEHRVSEAAIRRKTHEANAAGEREPKRSSDADLTRRERVVRHVERHLGEVEFTLSGSFEDDPTIDVLAVAPIPERPFWVLVTCGMSDRAMSVPHEVAEKTDEYDLAELCITLPKTWRLGESDLKNSTWCWPIDVLRSIASMPFRFDTWLAAGASLPNGSPIEPFDPSTPLAAALITQTPFRHEFDTLEQSDAAPINFYELVYLHADEYELCKTDGCGALFRRLLGVSRTRFDPKRRSVADVQVVTPDDLRRSDESIWSWFRPYSKPSIDLDRPLLLNDDDKGSRASHPGLVALDRDHVFRLYGPFNDEWTKWLEVASLVVGLCGLVVLTLGHFVVGAALLLLSVATFIPLHKRTRAKNGQALLDWQFRPSLGCTLPSIVIGADTVLTYTDLTRRSNATPFPLAPTLKFMGENLAALEERLPFGELTASIATYTDRGDPPDADSWADFFPLVVQCVTRSRTAQKNTVNVLTDESWHNLRTAILCMGPIDRGQGPLHRIDRKEFAAASQFVKRAEAKGHELDYVDLLTDAKWHDRFHKALRSRS